MKMSNEAQRQSDLLRVFEAPFREFGFVLGSADLVTDGLECRHILAIVGVALMDGLGQPQVELGLFDRVDDLLLGVSGDCVASCPKIEF